MHQGSPHPLSVVGIGTNPYVQVAGRPRYTVYGKRVRSNHQEGRLLGHQGCQDLPEIRVQTYSGSPGRWRRTAEGTMRSGVSERE